MNTLEQRVNQSQLSSKLINKLSKTFKDVGMGDKQFEELMSKFSLDKYSEQEIAVINKDLPKFCEALFNREHFTTKIDSIFYSEILQTLTDKVANEKDFSSVLIFSGMGGSIQTPSLRLPASLVPAVRILRNLKDNLKIENSRLPKVKILKADKLSSELNGFDINEVRRITELSYNFANAYLQNFCPDVIDCFSLETDIESQDENLTSLSIMELIENSQELNEALKTLRQMGQKHGGEQGVINSLKYASYHPIYSGVISGNSASKSQIIIELGGPTQDIFNTISLDIAKFIKSNKSTNSADKLVLTPSIYQVVKPGKIPVYYEARDGELNLSNFKGDIDTKVLDRATHIDYKVINSITPLEEYSQFVTKYLKNL